VALAESTAAKATAWYNRVRITGPSIGGSGPVVAPARCANASCRPSAHGPRVVPYPY